MKSEIFSFSEKSRTFQSALKTLFRQQTPPFGRTLLKWDILLIIPAVEILPPSFLSLPCAATTIYRRGTTDDTEQERYEEGVAEFMCQIFTFLPFISQTMWGTGLERDVVQFAMSFSPTKNCRLAKNIFGGAFCGTESRERWTKRT